MNYCYLLYIPGTNRTYIGATNDPAHRLKQHNGELAGGAKATRGKQWTQAFYLSGFPDWRTTLQFEWAWKYNSRGYPGLPGKLKGLKKLLALNKPTSTAIPYSLWANRVTLEATPMQRAILQKIDAAKFLLETQHSTMSSMTPESIATFTAQLNDIVTELGLLKVRMNAALAKIEVTESTKKEKKDPSAPKKPLTGYMLFCDTKRKEHPTEKLTVTYLGAQWHALSVEERAKFTPTA
jgi:predicted GIY-YIG superfamily endonuclease